MPRTRKQARPKTARERMQARRDRLRRQGLRPIQHWVPDLREPRVRQAIRKEIAILAQHQDNDSIDEWLEAVYAGVEDR
jgi:Antitoxin MazE-like